MESEIFFLLRSLGIITIGSFSIVAVIGYLVKSLYEKFLQNDFEVYKHKLQIETEKVKINLDIQKAKSMIIFSKLYEERALIIKELYDNITSINAIYLEIIKQKQLFPEKSTLISVEIGRAKEFLRIKQLFLSISTSKSCFDVLILFEKVLVLIEEEFNYSKKIEFALHSPMNTEFKDPDFLIELDSNKNLLLMEINAVLVNLETQFKCVIGIDEQ
ncbi:hypothetical protein ACFGVS_22900 [Mucilaginibacter sp. AW1-7]|jgi:hypothetical protein|uniref:hypothetical protein n=1 Tax=Mucilaginibacter sp. AW1-7 TaxID=3349874 RepID=UPI003F73E288